MQSGPHDPSSDGTSTDMQNVEAAEPDETTTAGTGGTAAGATSGAATGGQDDDEDGGSGGGSNGGKNEDPERPMRQPDSETADTTSPASDEGQTSPTTPDAAPDEGARSPADAATAGSGSDEDGSADEPETTPAPGADDGPKLEPIPALRDQPPGGAVDDRPEPEPIPVLRDPASRPNGAPADTEAPAADEPAPPPDDAAEDDLPATTELPQVDVPDSEMAFGPSPAPPEPAAPSRDERSAPAFPAAPPPDDAAEDVPVTTELPQIDAPTRQAPAGPPTIAPTPAGHLGSVYEVRPVPAPPAPGEPAPGEVTVERPRHLRPAEQRPRRFAPEAREKRERETTSDERRRRLVVLAMLAPVAVLALLFLGWVVDAFVHSGQVVRNVEVAGRSVGGVGEGELPDVVAGIGSDVAERPVVIQVPDDAAAGRSAGAAQTYEATAQALGLTVDEQATVDAAMDAGRDTPLPLRPFAWAASLFSTHEVELEYEMSEAQTSAALQIMQGDQLQAPTEPTIQLGDEGFAAVPGRPGTGLDPTQIADDLLAAADEDLEGRIALTGQPTDIAPHFSDADAEALATRANDMTAEGLNLKAGDFTVQVPAQQLRSWISPVDTDEGGERRLDLQFNTQAAQDALPALFAGMAAEPTNAGIRLEGGRPVVVPGQNGTRCRCDEGGARIWEALRGDQTELEFEAEVVEPEHTTQEVEGWGIREPIGGSRAHRNGADVGGPAPGYTTFFDPGAPRVTNIHRIADLTNGAVIAPGESFSLNEHVGPRTAAKGFVLAGAIRDGIHVDEIGGGVSQFFTTLFNAAYFAGLDIDEYQAHTENFPRYPDGREATGGHPNPDLVITNNTPHGVLIATSHSGTSVTVTLWSTPYITAEQTGLSTSRQGNCTNATSTRTRTWPDGRTDTDSFRATYRPGEGQFC